VTSGPATPFSVALVALTFVALPVVAVGGTFVQYALGGFTPCGQTMVAPVGTADSANTPAATRPPAGASHLRCEYLVI
jgi:hypothetical protein